MSDVPVDAEIIPEVGTELEVAQQAVGLFGTNDPVEIIERAGGVATALRDVLQRQSMIQDIKGKQYVKVEGWQTLGSMLGVVPVVAWTREIEGGWEARVEARTLDGRTVGAAESMCVKEEGGNWGTKATSNARRSMAQTRATSKALRGPLGFIVTLAGYSATPAEEIPQDGPAFAEPARRDSADDVVIIGEERAETLASRAFDLDLEHTLQRAVSHAAGRDVGDCSDPVAAVAAIASLSDLQAARLSKWLDRKAEESGGTAA